jgi:hypothetical protein
MRENTFLICISGNPHL